MNLPVPEDFGAVGDGSANDWNALNDFFNSWGVANIGDPIALALSPRKIYAFDAPLTITCGTTGANFQIRLYGNGSILRYTGGPGNGYCLRMGDIAGGKKGFYCHVSDLILRETNDGDGGLLLDYGDFCLYDNISVGGNYTEACIKVQNHNSLTFHNVNTVGADTGALFGHITNVFHWQGGKVQQHRLGIAYSGVAFSLQEIDLSIIEEWGIELSGARAGRVACYFEKIGSGQRNDQGGCIRLNNSNTIGIHGWINGTNGAIKDGTHAGYGVKCEGETSDIFVNGWAKLCQRALIDVGESSRNIVAGPTLRNSNGENDEFPVAQPCPLADGVRFRNQAAIYLLDKSHPAAPSSVIPASLDSWTKNQGADVLPENPPDYRGDGTAEVVTFPSSQPISSFQTNYMGASPGETYRMEFRARLIRFHESVIENRSSDLAKLRMGIDEGGTDPIHFSQIFARIGPGWQDFFVELHTTNGNGNLVFFFAVEINFEPIDIAVDFIRAYKLE